MNRAIWRIYHGQEIATFSPEGLFDPRTLLLTAEPRRGSLFRLSQESAGRRAWERFSKSTQRTGKNGRKWEKDTILTERTYRSIANKGVSFFKGQKRTGF
jgi:hypothetical protein